MAYEFLEEIASGSRELKPRSDSSYHAVIPKPSPQFAIKWHAKGSTAGWVLHLARASFRTDSAHFLSRGLSELLHCPL